MLIILIEMRVPTLKIEVVTPIFIYETLPIISTNCMQTACLIFITVLFMPWGPFIFIELLLRKSFNEKPIKSTM